MEAENGVGVLANASVVTSSGIDLSVKTESGSEKESNNDASFGSRQWIQACVADGEYSGKRRDGESDEAGTEDVDHFGDFVSDADSQVADPITNA